jgi:hypothetical protein
MPPTGYPLCRCDLATDYPLRCTCGLGLEYASREMHLIASGSGDQVPGALDLRSRPEWIATWLRIQQPTLPLTPSRVIHAVGSITATAIGRHRVTAAERDRRKAICEACPTDQYTSGQCRACSCIVAAKSLDRREFCPHGHWSAGSDRKGTTP